ncbi:MAG: tetratricopeptide repeat protein [Ignavibacteriales bacterium]|nr:tetratricopeptide repeat protein [Ignavibacteriales bacterium]
MKLFFYQLLFLTLIYFSPTLFPQNNTSVKFKTEAVELINSGRYGEAIDILNKYVSANPNSAYGFNLRGMCYEKRGNYEYAVYDYRTAKKINPTDDEISSNLNRATSDWYKLLYNKIEGHKREIAINPNIAKNYLEIGKCYKNLGNWSEAEIWYDLYLEKETASSDEIIRYSEILAKNSHISKGEPILKSYTENFPDDHRLFSRYGYFTLWLGKNKIAEDAFIKALEIRPYFKEAMDGLDLARGKGYIYSINDTTSRFNYGLVPTAKEYEIDRLYRVIKKNPADSENRFKLIEKLISVNRFEEANQQLQFLASKFSDQQRFKDLLIKLNTLKKSYYVEKIKYFEDQLIKDPTNKMALLELAKFYSLNNDYTSAENIYRHYLSIYPSDLEVKYKLAQILMWQNYLCDAAEIAKDIIVSSPDNKDYLLLAALINYWLDNDREYTQSLFERVLIKDPKNLEAMFGLANHYINSNKISEAENLISRISLNDSTSETYLTLHKSFNGLKTQNKLAQNYKILEEARVFSAKKDYNSAIKSFKEYLITDPNNKSVKLELADVYIANSELNKSINIYNDLLKSGNDYEIEKQRAKVYLWCSDSISALMEFKTLTQKNPEDIETKLFLGDAYLQNGQFQNARSIYEDLLKKSPDSHILKTRLGWLSGSNKFSFDRFPTYIQLIPRASYFTDNTDFSYSNYGVGFDLGVTNYLTIGLSGSRGKLSSIDRDLRFNQIKGSAYVRFNETFSGSGSFGQTYFTNDLRENIIEISLTAQKKNVFNISGYINYSDAAFILYSPFLVGNRLNAYQFGLNGEYKFKNGLIVSGKYSYLDVSDDNSGNQLVARLGKVFESDITAGYEYYFYSLKEFTPFYWSPKNFESHSLWSNWTIYNDEVFNFIIGGKIGLIPQNDFIVSEFYTSISYQIIKNLVLQTRYSTGSSYRSDTGYRSNAIQASLIWGL